MIKGKKRVRQVAVAVITAAIWSSPLIAQMDTVARERAREHLALVEQAYAGRDGDRAGEVRARVKGEESNLEHSLDWFVQNGEGNEALRFVIGMNFFWTTFGEVQKARQRLSQVLEMPSAAPPTELRAEALYDAGVAAFRQGDDDASRALNDESLAIGRRLDDKSTTARALIGLSRIALRHHDYAAVRRNAEEALRLQQASASASGEMTAVHMLAAAARMEGDTASASKFYELTLGIYGKDGGLAWRAS